MFRQWRNVTKGQNKLLIKAKNLVNSQIKREK